MKLQIAVINRIQTPKENKNVGGVTVSAQTHICFQNQRKVGSRFEISILCVIKRFLSLVPPSLSYLCADRAA